MHNHPSRRILIFRSIGIAAAFVVFKLIAYAKTDSMAMLASAADSLMDFMVSFLNFVLIRSAAKPADHNHPYGHGKIESLGGLLQTVIIGGVAIGIAGVSVHRLLSPQPLENPVAGLLVNLIALAINFWHVRNLRASMVETGSAVMATEYLHYATDILVYLGVIASFSLFKLTGGLFWDPVISLIIVVYLLRATATVFRGALSELLDEQLPKPDLVAIDGAIRSFSPKIIAYHNLRTRKVGPTKFIEFHVELRDVEKFEESHQITAGLISKLKEMYAGAIVTVHADPEGIAE